MDPNTTIGRLRELSALEHEGAAAELAELFTALDEWIMKGGFMPRPWARGNMTSYAYLLHKPPSNVDIFGSWESARRAALEIAQANGREPADHWTGGWRSKQGGHLLDTRGHDTGYWVSRRAVRR